MIKLKIFKNSFNNVLYYSIRDLRIHDNWAIIHSQNIANHFNSKMYIVFSVLENFLDASIRQYSFLKEGLMELDEESKKFNIAFHLLFGNPKDTLLNFIKKYKIGYLIIEQFPLKIFKDFIETFKTFDVNIHQVDAHNIIPVWIASNKREYNARTLRLKINKIKDEFLISYPILKKNKEIPIFQNNKFNLFFNHIKINNIPQIENKEKFIGGYNNGMKQLIFFLKNILLYEKKNNANENNSSRLSFWLHFGMISSQKCIIELNKLNINDEYKKDFIEQIFIRKELADNFCFYTENYTKITECYEWARLSLKIHEKDKRIIYPLEILENANTNDIFWNSCQKYIIKHGYLNGYLRMYWAKKILEWSKTAQEAIDKTIILNDRYLIDGRDPKGYVGILWSIAGLHDRAFKERDIYGKIRFMSFNGLKKYINIQQFILNN